MRYLSVRERSMRVLQTQLENILQENDYNTNVQKVERTRQAPTTPPSSGTITLMVGEGRQEPLCNVRTYEPVQVHIFFAIQRIENADTEFDLFLSDIQNALKCALVDPTHPDPNQTSIYFKVLTTQPLYGPSTSGATFGEVLVEMQIWWFVEDNRLWDNVQDQLVPVDE